MRALEARILVMRIPKIKCSEDKGSGGESSEDEEDNSPMKTKVPPKKEMGRLRLRFLTQVRKRDLERKGSGKEEGAGGGLTTKSLSQRPRALLPRSLKWSRVWHISQRLVLLDIDTDH